jgi:ankyrin repeat protein
MENWTNLNKVLVLERTDTAKKEAEAQTLVELSMLGVTREFKDIKKILKNGATINCFADMATPLIATIRTDNIEMARFLINTCGASISYKPQGLMDNAFWEALKTKKHNFLQFFIDKRCGLSRQEKLTPLIFATKESDVTAVEMLLQHYAIKVNERDDEGNTALHYNVSKNPQTASDTLIGQMLIAAGADVNGRNFKGETPEDMAIDSTAKSMLFSSKLDKDLPVKDIEPPVMEKELQEEMGIAKTKTNRLKI